jgi:hypothetical protein
VGAPGKGSRLPSRRPASQPIGVRPHARIRAGPRSTGRSPGGGWRPVTASALPVSPGRAHVAPWPGIRDVWRQPRAAARTGPAGTAVRTNETYSRGPASSITACTNEIRSTDLRSSLGVLSCLRLQRVPWLTLPAMTMPYGVSIWLANSGPVLERTIEHLNIALEESPVPEFEWNRLTDVLGLELLSRLLGISATSVRRYRAAARTTPDDVAGRLHFLSLIVGDLSGAYNEFGTRQWFERKRPRLGSRPKRDGIRGFWNAPRLHRLGSRSRCASTVGFAGSGSALVRHCSRDRRPNAG